MINDLERAEAIQRTDVIGNYTAVFGQTSDLSPKYNDLKGAAEQELYITEIFWNGGNTTDPIIDALQFKLNNGFESNAFFADSLDKDIGFDYNATFTEDEKITFVSVGFANYGNVFPDGSKTFDSVIVELDFFAEATIGSTQVLDIGGGRAAEWYVQTSSQLNGNIVAAGVTSQQYDYDQV